MLTLRPVNQTIYSEQLLMLNTTHSKYVAVLAVRYAWENYPEGISVNLFTVTDLPAAPFRTDSWPVQIEGITED